MDAFLAFLDRFNDFITSRRGAPVWIIIAIVVIGAYFFKPQSTQINPSVEVSEEQRVVSVEVTSEPEGAVVSLSDAGERKPTPAKFDLDINSRYVFYVSKEGYETAQVEWPLMGDDEGSAKVHVKLEPATGDVQAPPESPESE